MIKRRHYLTQIAPFTGSDLIEVITGIRRCGKSIILQQSFSELEGRTDHIISLNFENKRTRALLPDAESVIHYQRQAEKGR